MKDNEFLATNVIHLMKRSLIRVYILLIIFIVLFVISIVDSMYQRHKIEDILTQYNNTHNCIHSK